MGGSTFRAHRASGARALPAVAARADAGRVKPATTVVGTDGSPNGTAAVRWAAAAAQRDGHPLLIVVACPWEVPGRWYGSVRDPAAAADERAGGIAADAFEHAAHRRCALRAIAAEPVQARDRLRTELVDQLAGWPGKYPDVAVEYRVVDGGPGAVLVDQSRAAQLLVVGTRDDAGPPLGPVARHLVHHAHCPVLIARGR